MRIFTALAALGLLASAYLAPRHHEGRATAFSIARFVIPDARERARKGEEARELGVAMDAYKELAEGHPGDLGLLRDRIRTGFLIGAVSLGQADIPELVWTQAKAYVEGRKGIDPDGSLLKGILDRWLDERLHFDMAVSVYPRASTAIYLAARGDAAGREMLFELARRGETMGGFHMQFFPYVRRYHPGWAAVEPLVVHYMEKGDAAARVEAGVALLDYNHLFGVGDELVERHLPSIRAAVREMLDRMRKPANQPSDAGRAAIFCMALLAMRGEEEEMRTLAAAKSERELLYYVPFADTVRVARVCAGLDPFASMGPLTVRFKDLDPLDQELYFLAVAHLATRAAKQGGFGGTEEILDFVEAGFDGNTPSKVLAMQMLLRLAPERGKRLVASAMEGRAAMSIYAGVLAGGVEDPVALYLPALASREPDFAAMAAATLRASEGPSALQR